MLRYVRLDPLQQTVSEFCCSRILFSRVNIKIPDIKLLFDRDYIFNTFMKYKRGEEEHSNIIRAVCGKCDGYGFYDWVSRLTCDKHEPPLWTRGDNKPLTPKNEDPISKLYLYSSVTCDTYYYISSYDPSDLLYRCEQCFGTGMTIEGMSLKPITIEDLPKQQIKHKSFISKLVRYIKEMITC
jgi:hypothetical protein